MLSYVSNPKITEINLLKFYKLTTEHYKRGGTAIAQTTKAQYLLLLGTTKLYWFRNYFRII